jgi:hypothetical protein
MFILYLEYIIIEKLIDIVIQELISKFGILEEFITNRDKLFISNI